MLVKPFLYAVIGIHASILTLSMHRLKTVIKPAVAKYAMYTMATKSSVVEDNGPRLDHDSNMVFSTTGTRISNSALDILDNIQPS